MNNYNNPSFPAPAAANGGRVQHRQSGDFRAPPANGVPGANGNGSVPVSGGSHRGVSNGHGGRAMGHFDGPRSPPNKNSTAHVPCKFFRQGACQAGKACPFMHSTEPTVDNAPCKYFQKGNCKFGAKCALAHILPNGVRVNRPNFGGNALNLGGRMNVHNQDAQPPGISLLSMQAHMAAPPPQNFPYIQDEQFNGPPQRSQYEGVPTIDTTFSSLPNSNYGSPPNETRLGVSPIQKKGLSVLDVPLPSSFDSQGVSTFARYGPIAASVPSRFGIESSSPSSYQGKAAVESTTLRNLHNSAFGEDSRTPNNGFGSSPPPAGEDHLGLGRRILHSERFSRQKVMSASVPRGGVMMKDPADEWEQTFTFEEDCIPSSIAGDVLTPQERNRRSSRTEEENLLNHRISLSGLGTPAEPGSKVGSPAASSPSRFGPLFSRSHKAEAGDSSPFSAGSAFGHVGSPLRNSSLHPGASPSLRAVAKPTSGPGDISPFVSSPPRQASMSIITQQLQRTRLQSRTSSNNNVNEGVEGAPGMASLHPGIARVASGSSVGSTTSGRLDRAVSSSSIGRERIEEEQGLFSMEDEEEMEKKKDGSPWQQGSNKRFSGGWGGLAGLGATKSSASSTPSGLGLGPIGAPKSNPTSAHVGSAGASKEGTSGPWNSES